MTLHGPRVLFSMAILVVVCSASSAQIATKDRRRQAFVPPPPTVFRITDLDLRDPHIFVDLGIFCPDFTDTGILTVNSVNQQFQDSISLDNDADGFLDLNLMLILQPLVPNGSSGSLTVLEGICTEPLATTQCVVNPVASADAVNYSNADLGTLLGPIAGTLRPYSPAVISAAAPGFVTEPTELTLDLGSLSFSLQDAQIAATYTGSPVSLVQGLIRGFLEESVADAALLPPDLAVVGGLPLSSLLPGGANNCNSGDDRDSGGPSSGWWVYLNFEAEQVPFSF